MSENITLNRIPSLTWNWLRMNDVKVEMPLPVTGECPCEVTVPDGVAYEKESAAFANDIKGGSGETYAKLIEERIKETAVFSAAEGTNAEAPVVIKFRNEAGASTFNKFVITAEENANITVVMSYTSDREAGGQAGFMTLLRAKRGARINLVQINTLGESYTLMNDVGAVAEDDAHISISHLFLGGSKVYQGCNIDLKGRNAGVEEEIGYFLNKEQLLDMNYVVLHNGRTTDSGIRTNGVLSGNASKLFRGTIDFRNGCAGSKGSEIEEVILRDDTVINKTIPVILCAEEDVEGNHGATIGCLDEDLIFYLQSRGLEEEEIYKLIANSRLASFCRRIPDENVRKETFEYFSEGRVKENE